MLTSLTLVSMHVIYCSMEKILFLLLFVNLINNNKPNRDNVYQELIHQEVKYPQIVIKQAIIETNCGKTGVGKTKNNLFGFRTNKGYKSYDNWKLSISDYKRWQDKRFSEHEKLHHKNSKCDYYHFLCHIGYVDGKKCSERGKQYVNKLKSM